MRINERRGGEHLIVFLHVAAGVAPGIDREALRAIVNTGRVHLSALRAALQANSVRYDRGSREVVVTYRVHNPAGDGEAARLHRHHRKAVRFHELDGRPTVGSGVQNSAGVD